MSAAPIRKACVGNFSERRAASRPLLTRPRPVALASAAAVACLLAPPLAWSQQTTTAPADQKNEGKLETVTVTATKRAQPLQKTPIAISVVSGATLEEANLNNLEAVVTQLPTVNFRTNASNKDSALFVRGVGTISTSPGVEPTVSTVLDGVVTSRPGQATLDLVEIDRIEILRGPQGTLFGKNASAGVINIITRAPSKAFTGYADLSLFTGNEQRLRAGVSGEMVPNVMRGSLSAMAGKFDGLITNVFDGSTVGGFDRSGLRGRLDLTPSRDLKVSLIADATTAKDSTPTGVAYSTTVRSYPTLTETANPNFAAAVAPVVASPTNRQINSEMRTEVTDKNQGVSAQMDWTGLAGHQLTSITAYRTWSNTQAQDQDRLGTLYRGFNRLADQGQLDFSQVSQELRIASTTAGPVEYVAGLFYIEGKNDERYERTTSNCPANTDAVGANGLAACTPATTVVNNGVALYGTRTKSGSVFGEGTFNLTPQLRTIAGLRYTTDSLSYFHGRNSTAAAPGIAATRARVEGSTKESAVSGRIGPQFDITKDVMVYGTYSQGYKGPAYNVFFNMSPTQDNVIGPETSKSFEVGVKSTLADGTVRLNVAAFKTDYSGYQANVPDLLNGVIVTRLINAGDVTTEGFEVDLTARLTTNLTLTSALANVKARVKNFACPPGAAASCDINGQPLPYSPDWKASLRLKHTMPVSDTLTLDTGFDMNWQSRTNFDLSQQPDSFQPDYAIFNASIGLSSTAGWRVALVGKNLADKSYASFIQSSGNHINRYVPRDDRRYFGINARYDF